MGVVTFFSLTHLVTHTLDNPFAPHPWEMPPRYCGSQRARSSVASVHLLRPRREIHIPTVLLDGFACNRPREPESGWWTPGIQKISSVLLTGHFLLYLGHTRGKLLPKIAYEQGDNCSNSLMRLLHASDHSHSRLRAPNYYIPLSTCTCTHRTVLRRIQTTHRTQTLSVSSCSMPPMGRHNTTLSATTPVSNIVISEEW